MKWYPAIDLLGPFTRFVEFRILNSKKAIGIPNVESDNSNF